MLCTCCPLHPREPLRKAAFGAITQTVTRRLTDTQGHAASRWQSWGASASVGHHLPHTTNPCSALKGSERGYLLSPWREPSVPWCHLELLGCRVPCLWLVRPRTSCQLSPAPCPLLPHLELPAEHTGRANTGWVGLSCPPTALWQQLLLLAPLVSPIKTNQQISLALMPPWHSKHPARCPSPTAAAQVDLEPNSLPQ